MYFSKKMQDRLKAEEDKLTTKAADVMMSRFGMFVAVMMVALSISYLVYHIIRYIYSP